MIIRRFNNEDPMDSIKITGTKWYVDIEYKGSIARFDGEMCVDGFYATANSLSWIKRSREISADDFPKLIDAVIQQNKKNTFKVYFCNDDGSPYG